MVGLGASEARLELELEVKSTSSYQVADFVASLCFWLATPEAAALVGDGCAGPDSRPAAGRCAVDEAVTPTFLFRRLIFLPSSSSDDWKLESEAESSLSAVWFEVAVLVVGGGVAGRLRRVDLGLVLRFLNENCGMSAT